MTTPTPNHTCAQRLVALGYGLVCHASFLAAVAAMAFSLFTGLRFGIGPYRGWQGVAANAALLALFPVSHSWLLSPSGRRFMARLVPLGIGNKISMTVFATLSSLQLLAAFVLWSPSGVVWWQAGAGLRTVIGLLAGGAWLLLGKSMADAQLDLQLGLVGWWAVFRNRKTVCKPFATRGLYRYVRQPIYISFSLLLWLTATWTPDQLVLATAWTGYCVIGSVLKERRFIRYFGDAFRAYQQRVPFWIPGPGKPNRTTPEIASGGKTDADVIIVGAGPIGLLLANLLGQRGKRVVVAERRTRAPHSSMAIGVTPPSLEILKLLDLDGEFIRQGIPITSASVYENGRRIGDVNFSGIRARYRCILSIPQSVTLSILRRNLGKYPTVTLLEGMRFVQYRECGSQVLVRLQDVESQAYSEFTATYLVGSDGHRSEVRQQSGIRFPGRAYRTQFFMADYRDSTGWGADARLFFGTRGSVESFPLPGGCRRWIIQMPNQACAEEFSLGRTVADQVCARTGVELQGDPMLFESWFRPQRRLAATYRQGRVLLCGDAAHVMSPIGGQGMNTGFADAAHLAQAMTEVLEQPDDADRVFTHYTRSRRRAFRIAADRAARGMWLGTRRGVPASSLRHLLIAYMLFRPAIRERLAHCFAMLSITARETRHLTRKVAAQ